MQWLVMAANRVPSIEPARQSDPVDDKNDKALINDRFDRMQLTVMFIIGYPTQACEPGQSYEYKLQKML